MSVPLDEVFKAAGDPTRLRLLNLLAHGPICVCDLQRVLGLTQSTVSRHLAVLRHARLVTDERHGNRVLYSLAPADTIVMQRFFEFLNLCSQHQQVMRDDRSLLESSLRQGQCAAEESAPIVETVTS